MKFLPLILKNLFRRKIRTGLTILSIAVAIFLFGLLAVIDTAFTAGLDVARADRLVVTGRNGVIQLLPRKYQDQIRRVKGVSDVAHATWFGGIYQDERNMFQQFAVDEAYFRVYPEFKIPKEQFDAYLADREGAIVGVKTAERFHWKVGDRVPLKGSIFQGTWEFNIRGIYRGSKPQDDESNFFLHSEYLKEGAADYFSGLVGFYIVKIDDPDQALAVAAAIDKVFANSSAETKTQPEAIFIAGWVNSMGNIRLLVVSIGIIVFFTLMLVTGNTMAIAVRERTSEWAVLKTLGFGDKAVLGLVLAESLAIAVIGGAIGLTVIELATANGSPVPGVLPIFYLPTVRLMQGIACVFVVGLAAGAIPGILAMRLRIVDALRRV
jgi:putative ABC transport system permease protein